MHITRCASKLNLNALKIGLRNFSLCRKVGFGSDQELGNVLTALGLDSLKPEREFLKGDSGCGVKDEENTLSKPII
jgi:hypothetical protein